MTQYHIRLPDPARARSDDPALSFTAHGADGFAEQLREALATNTLFERWRATQPEPDEVDPALGEVDPTVEVEGEQADLAILLRIRTRLGSGVLRQRLRWLAGSNWELRDVTR
jgi:hypothetical protein